MDEISPTMTYYVPLVIKKLQRFTTMFFDTRYTPEMK
jgi:hypothetical protein